MITVGPTQHRRRLAVIVVVTAIVLSAALGIYLFAGRSGTQPVKAIPHSQVMAHEATLALSKLTTDPASLIPDDQKGTVDLSAAVPKGSTLTIEERTWKPATPTSGTIFAKLTSPGQPNEEYLVTMAKQHGQWKVLMTIQTSGSPK